jgi:CRISP-associated protein Cas1
MIKRTLYFGNPCYLHKASDQLVFENQETKEKKTVPIEDIGIVVLDNPQITISNALLMALMDNNAAVFTGNWQHMPEGLMLPMAAHHAYTELVKYQIEASEPLKKNLWQQTVTSKIDNQSLLLQSLDIDTKNMKYWASSVRSGDPDNYEARAAAYYWENIFSEPSRFRRHRFGTPPNNLLNYGYAILRGTIARSLVGSGMLTVFGIHHRNKYNPYCLADDIMEPYRPYVDKIVLNILDNHDKIDELTKEIKTELLKVPAIDVMIDGQSSPLMVAAQRTTASLMRCFQGENRKILYPEFKHTA